MAVFIWLAENLATFSHAWLYPAQHTGWTLVTPEKLGAWLLLMIISFVLVAAVNPPQADTPSVPLTRPQAHRRVVMRHPSR